MLSTSLLPHITSLFSALFFSLSPLSPLVSSPLLFSQLVLFLSACLLAEVGLHARALSYAEAGARICADCSKPVGERYTSALILSLSLLLDRLKQEQV